MKKIINKIMKKIINKIINKISFYKNNNYIYSSSFALPLILNTININIDENTSP